MGSGAAGSDGLRLSVSEAWRASFAEARVGVLLVEGVANAAPSSRLQRHAREVESELRRRYVSADRAALVSLPVVQAYQRHFRVFGQTYHVVRQLESVVLKGKPLESPSGLVLAMFAVELDTLLLTAGHDADALQPPLTLDVSVAGERFVGIGGREHELRGGDMLIRDRAGIISAVIYGPDERTRLVTDTRRALFTTYAPSGVSVAQLSDHLDRLADLVRQDNPSAVVQLRGIYPQ